VKRHPIGWRWRRAWLRTVAATTARVAARHPATPRARRRATNPAQPWCPQCRLFVRALCRNPNPEPCGGVCTRCCGGHTPPKPEGATA